MFISFPDLLSAKRHPQKNWERDYIQTTCIWQSTQCAEDHGFDLHRRRRFFLRPLFIRKKSKHLFHDKFSMSFSMTTEMPRRPSIVNLRKFNVNLFELPFCKHAVTQMIQLLTLRQAMKICHEWQELERNVALDGWVEGALLVATLNPGSLYIIWTKTSSRNMMFNGHLTHLLTRITQRYNRAQATNFSNFINGLSLRLFPQLIRKLNKYRNSNNSTVYTHL